MGTLLVSVEMIKSARYLTSLGGARPICDKWSTPYQTLDTKLPLQGHSQEFVFTEAKKEDARKKCADIKCFAISYTSVIYNLMQCVCVCVRMFLTTFSLCLPGLHLTPASSICPQLWSPRGLAGQFKRRASSPAHLTSSNQIWPVPGGTVVRARAPAVYTKKKQNNISVAN